jgi:hypothetical protein
MALPLEVLADLSLNVDGEDVKVRGEGDRVVVDLPNLRAGRRLLMAGPFRRGQRERTTRRIHEALRLADITMEVRLHGDVIARVGAEARPNAVARLLNLGDIEVRPVQPIATTARRRPLLTLGIASALAGLLAWLFFRGSGDDS